MFDINIVEQKVMIQNRREKENRPAKQGGIYSLNLGKNNGPFLAKDIMLSNPKSIQLLVGTQVVKSHISLAKSLEEFDARKKKEEEGLKDSFLKEEKGMGLAENIIDYSVYLNNQISCLKKSSGELGSQLKRFKGELQQLQKKINFSNSSNMSDLAPSLKYLYNAVKKSFNDEKDKVYWLTRELQDVGSTGRRLSQQMRQCDDRITVIQSIIGVKTEPFDELVVTEELEGRSEADI